uniref:Uncharacterized protein n=1 Tax=Knipowitschia caucasica TaxID=637954 RepID=A0AAV2L0U7_KNICA
MLICCNYTYFLKALALVTRPSASPPLPSSSSSPSSLGDVSGSILLSVLAHTRSSLRPRAILDRAASLLSTPGTEPRLRIHPTSPGRDGGCDQGPYTSAVIPCVGFMAGGGSR